MKTSSNDALSKDKIIDSVEVLDDGFVAGKYALNSFIYIWHVQHSIGGVQPELRTIDIIPIYKLVWCETDNYYMEISANYGKPLILNGYILKNLALILNSFFSFRFGLINLWRCIW